MISLSKKKILISSLVFIICLEIGFFYFLLKVYQPVPELVEIKLPEKPSSEEKVLKFLEEKLEFCEIIKSDISGDKGEFWLICNGRPFYAEYDKGKVNYQLNGWGFLRNTEYWPELENCDFYNSEKVGQNYNLIFYCPRDFDAKELKARIYQFDLASLKINKVGEEDFLEIINKDIVNIYPFLKECQMEKFETVPEGDPPTLSLTYSCKGEEKWNVLMLGATSLLPPISMSTNLSEIERAKISFEKAFECEIESADRVGEFISIKSSCKDKEIVVNYDFLSFDRPVAEYEIDYQAPCLEFGKYFIFPPLEEIGKTTFIKEKIHQTPKALIYKVGDRIIEIGVDEINNKIVLFWLKSEGFYYGVYYE